MNIQTIRLRRGVITPTRVSTRVIVLTIGLILVALHAQPAFAKNNDKSVDARIRDGALVVTGTPHDDTISLRLRAADPTTLEIDGNGDGTADISVKRDEFTAIVVNARAGDDEVRIDDAGGIFTGAHPTTLNGGPGSDMLVGGRGPETLDGDAGDDTLLGGDEVDTLVGGPGRDFVDGDRGNDVGILGPGEDTFRWDPGDGRDVIEGGPGLDTMLFNGSGAPESFDASAIGGRLRFFRNVGAITMDTDDVEVVALNALGGADSLIVNDLASTDVTILAVDLALPAGTGTSDGQADTVIVKGTAGDDDITVAGDASGVRVTGLAVAVEIAGTAAADDTLQIDGLAGVNSVDPSGLAAGTIALVVT